MNSLTPSTQQFSIRTSNSTKRAKALNPLRFGLPGASLDGMACCCLRYDDCAGPVLLRRAARRGARPGWECYRECQGDAY